MSDVAADTATPPTQQRRRLLFESETCSRCMGSGKFSWNRRDGNRCFGCGGCGERLTKRGAAAQAFFAASVKVTQSDLTIGDTIMVSGITLGGSLYTYAAEVMEIGELHEYARGLENGEWIPRLGRTLVLKAVKSGEISRSTGPDSATCRKIWDPATAAEKRAAALAYQATLNASGKVARRQAATTK